MVSHVTLVQIGRTMPQTALSVFVECAAAEHCKHFSNDHVRLYLLFWLFHMDSAADTDVFMTAKFRVMWVIYDLSC